MNHSEKALIYGSELDFISRCVLDYPEIETGGDLFGFWTHSGRPVIHYAIGPGPHSRRTVSFFNQDVDYLRSFGDRLRALHGLQHVGEWHSHHRLGLCRPSSHDSDTVANAIRDCQLRSFLLVICTITESRSDIRGFLYNKTTSLASQPIEWVVLAGQNMLRQSIDEEMSDLVHQPKTAHAALGVIVRTTLYETGEFASVPKNSWVGTKAGRELLKAIHEEIASGAAAVTMTLLENRQISLTWVQESKTNVILFPASSPAPATYFQSVRDKGRVLVWDACGWKDATDATQRKMAKALIEGTKHTKKPSWMHHA